MTDYEFKKAILKNMRELTTEVRALREVLSRPDISDDVVKENEEVRRRTKKRLFTCRRCNCEFETNSYTTRETNITYWFQAPCPQCKDTVSITETK